MWAPIGGSALSSELAFTSCPDFHPVRRGVQETRVAFACRAPLGWRGIEERLFRLHFAGERRIHLAVTPFIGMVPQAETPTAPEKRGGAFESTHAETLED
jgi:hypothetical protein